MQPNDPALYVLGDNHSEREVVAPESMLRQIAREENGGGGNVIVQAQYTASDDQLVRLLAPKLEAYWARRGPTI